MVAVNQSPTPKRLKKRDQFVAISKQGKSVATKGLVLQFLAHQNFDNAQGSSFSVGFTVTKKVGNAVVRNRVKRRLRAVVAEVFGSLACNEFDYVVIGRKATLEREFLALVKDMRYALHQVK